MDINAGARINLKVSKLCSRIKEKEEQIKRQNNSLYNYVLFEKNYVNALCKSFLKKNKIK